MWKSKIPEGTVDLDMDSFEKKEQACMLLKQLYQGAGYRQVQTPTFEYYELFINTKGTLQANQMVKLIDSDGRILVLRPDATLPIARMAAAAFSKGITVNKYSYITSIFRFNKDQQQALHQREFTQAGVEFFGRADLDADLEVIKLAIQTIEESGFSNFTIDLGQANFFKALIETTTLDDEDQEFIKQCIEEKNFSELQRFVAELDLSEDYQRAIRSIPSLYGKPEQVLEKAETLVQNPRMKDALNQLATVYHHLVGMGYGANITFDLGLINHLNYYTGVIFQGYVANYGKPLLLGGRYDDLTKQFGIQIPATGFGVNIDDLVEAKEAVGWMK
ncbi:ATP phosphoribosyltransferase regulatory subunit [Rubeoparvulum massiliense]|uniref:ATP phosphoribosyltransferase regulatory subunit n=1 Tax=Rubeoparvulum massiliense TaxID=1631346 RepID=UPI00065E7519|nr:ATP phosphoribosyltransferase regulatory subunit [Rubeoparvulum massiliense]